MRLERDGHSLRDSPVSELTLSGGRVSLALLECSTQFLGQLDRQNVLFGRVRDDALYPYEFIVAAGKYGHAAQVAIEQGYAWLVNYYDLQNTADMTSPIVDRYGSVLSAEAREQLAVQHLTTIEQLQVMTLDELRGAGIDRSVIRNLAFALEKDGKHFNGARLSEVRVGNETVSIAKLDQPDLMLEMLDRADLLYDHVGDDALTEVSLKRGIGGRHWRGINSMLLIARNVSQPSIELTTLGMEI